MLSRVEHVNFLNLSVRIKNNIRPDLDPNSKRSTALERSVKYFTVGLKPVSRLTNLTRNSDVDQDT